MCGVPPQERGEGSGGGSHRWPDIALASRSEALTWQRRAAGARIAAPDSWRFAARATDGVREPLALHSHGGSGSSRLSTSYDFRAPFKRLSPVRHVSLYNEGNQDIKLSRICVEKTKNGSCFFMSRPLQVLTGSTVVKRPGWLRHRCYLESVKL